MPHSSTPHFECLTSLSCPTFPSHPVPEQLGSCPPLLGPKKIQVRDYVVEDLVNDSPMNQSCLSHRTVGYSELEKTPSMETNLNEKFLWVETPGHLPQ